ncbi:phage tail protein [Arcticibacterium luteifluviistationis]|uniref:Phage tail protein n=1 Tax=Arcticibacterium luteifluviistationis TaxID=1784714 RepID=A0A2Z4GEB7_9BACT|nr:tail fiber protein [Arcticibacterium luteifluviistationis]AWV99375.1 phage tail protein [Arcticibacterium luteifluviistationis]
MAEPFVGEIRMFAGNFAPRGWAFCDGQLLAVSQNDALFSLLGTIYGGDGRTTFGLPDLRGRVPVHAGSGPGLSPRGLGAKSGSEKETITENQIPSHSHGGLEVTESFANSTQPIDAVLASNTTEKTYTKSTGSPVSMSSSAVSSVGGDSSHSNLMPFVCIHYIIALVGVYPSSH